jgi:hypothetical protein
MKQVAVLFAREDSIYKSFQCCDVYDIKRDARTFHGGLPVVAHPPCRAWASLRFHAKPRPGEKDLAFFAIDSVRKNGGVLEHPEKTALFNVAGLPQVGEYDEHGGFTIIVDQNWFGHRARKRTRLYIVGCKISDLPPMPIKLGEATHTVGLWSGRNKATCRPSINKREFESTPAEFAEWLVDVAKLCGLKRSRAA